MDLVNIKTLSLKDEVYVSYIIIYLNTIILCCINKAILQTLILSSNQYISLFIYVYESDSNTLKLINHDSNAIATIKQMHSFSYNAIYYKYAPGKDRQCQIDFLCQIIDTFFIGQYGVIKLKRNNSWVNL